MSEKTQVIIREIITSKACYTVGSVPAGLVSAVEKINYFSSIEGYNKNKTFEGPCYVVYFIDSKDRRLIPLKEVIDVGLHVFEKENTKKKNQPPEAFVYESASGKDTEMDGEDTE